MFSSYIPWNLEMPVANENASPVSANKPLGF